MGAGQPPTPGPKKHLNDGYYSFIPEISFPGNGSNSIAGILFHVSDSHIGLCREIHSSPIYFTAYYLSGGSINGLDSHDYNDTGSRANGMRDLVINLIAGLEEFYTNEFSYQSTLNYDKEDHQADEYQTIG